MNPITVIDSIMGSGKTSAMINIINSDTENRYIFVTPYLDEIDRICKRTNYKFKQPYNDGEGKLEYLHQLLSSGENIATTHALFLMATSETVQLIREGGYILILDEALDIFKEYNDIVKSLDNKTVNKGDVRWLIQEGYMSVKNDYSVSWDGATVNDFHYSEIERLARNGTLRCIDDCLYWEYPIEVFKAFKGVYVLTYMFESTMLAAYMNIHNFSYDKVSAIKNEDGSYGLCAYFDDTELKRELYQLVNIYSGKLNEIGQVRNAFSINWLNGRNGNQIRKIKNAMRRYKDILNVPSSVVMWTTTKQRDFYKKLEELNGFKYIRQLKADEQNMSEEEIKNLRCFVPCTARATNKFDKRTTLLYMLNRFLCPEIEKYFSRMGYTINEDDFATSELLQWMWRSAIRKGEKINIYIPSSRMRRLLYKWFGVDETRDVPRPNKVLEKGIVRGFS